MPVSKHIRNGKNRRAKNNKTKKPKGYILREISGEIVGFISTRERRR